MTASASACRHEATPYPIPWRINLLLVFVVLAVHVGLLWSASHVSNIGALCVLAALFGFLNITAFALMHEAIHSVLHPSPRVNALLGTLCAALFPCPFSPYRNGHFLHHQRNRSDAEMFDYYLPHQSRLWRNIWLYFGNLLGGYWLIVACGTLLYVLVPWLPRSRKLQKLADRLGIGAGFSDIARLPVLRSWIECVWVVAWHVSICTLLDITWTAWLCCYAAFALHWSTLQYCDHAFSPRHPMTGAWNLRGWSLPRWVALNYHYHQVHHIYPALPWIYLPHFAPPLQVHPRFSQVLLWMWRGVQPAPPMSEVSDAVAMEFRPTTK